MQKGAGGRAAGSREGHREGLGEWDGWREESRGKDGSLLLAHTVVAVYWPGNLTWKFFGYKLDRVKRFCENITARGRVSHGTFFGLSRLHTARDLPYCHGFLIVTAQPGCAVAAKKRVAIPGVGRPQEWYMCVWISLHSVMAFSVNVGRPTLKSLCA